MRTVLALWCATAPLWAPAQVDYFQQEVNHRIEVRLDDAAHVLHGSIETEYVNNSPQSLEFLWLHVWPNAYEGPTTALAKQQFRSGNLFMYWAMARDLGGIDSLDFAVNGQRVEWSYHPEHRDIVRLELPQPLAPGGRLAYTTPFRVQLPSGQISRLGHIGQSYQLTQWYPKPAVYDRDGWHEMPYLNQGEFYSEYGSFDVRITLPENYTVGATGDFVDGSADNPREVERLDSLVGATEHLLASGSHAALGMDFPPSSPRMKTLHYRQSAVHDFAWFADKRWMVLRGTVEEPAVTTWAMFTPAEADLWKRAPEYLHDAIVSYSKWNGDYPYRQVTAVDGTISAGGGMEYPNVTVIGNSGSDLGLETVIVHEVGHNWFYGILGTNERTHAWMDEGINSFNETRYFVEKYGDTLTLAGRGVGPFGLFEAAEATDFPYAMRDQFAYLLSARLGADQPMACHSAEFSDLNYGTIVYKKSAAAMEHLRGALGTEVFDAGMQLYFDRWKFKHPGPDDLRSALEEASGADLAWFFDELVPTTGAVDYRLARASKGTNGRTELTLVNAGEINAPIRIDALDGAGRILGTTWTAGRPDRHKVEVVQPEGTERWVIDAAGQMLEYNRRNNTLRARGPLPAVEPISFRFLTRLDREDRTPVFWTPLAAWNVNDGWMAGLLLHNVTLPVRNFHWYVAPMRAFDAEQWVGIAGLGYRTGAWTWEAGVRRFGDAFDEAFSASTYSRGQLAVTGRFNRAPQSGLKSALRIEAVEVHSDRTPSAPLADMLYPTRWAQAIGGEYAVETSGVRSRSVWTAAFRSMRLRPEWGAEGPVWEGARVAQVALLRSESRWEYNRAGKELRVAAFAGWLLGDAGVYPLQVSGINPAADPLYDGVFSGRGAGTGWASRNNLLDHGGLPLPEGAGVAEEALLSVRMDWQLPLGAPVNVYGGVALVDGLGVATAGLALDLGIFQLFLPLAAPGWTASAYRPWEGVVWSLNLLEANPISAIQAALK